MRTTFSIDDDVLNAAREMARVQGTTAGKIISELARRGLTRTARGPWIPRNGFWVLANRGGLVTSALVKQLAEGDS